MVESLPQYKLWTEPTPLERFDHLASVLGLSELYVKRDDANGVGMGGNKVRQLEYYLGEAIAQAADTILMTGAVQSNFVRTAASACAKLGLQCHVQLENRVPNDTELYRTSGNVLLDRLFGAIIHTYPEGEDEEGADLQLQKLAQDLKFQGRKPYVVHMHPSHPPLGALGYVDCAGELISQFEELNFQPDRIFVASGSGNTHGGLVFGLRKGNFQTPITGVCVRRNKENQFPRIVDRVEKISRLLKSPNPTDQNDIDLNDEFLSPGYGQAGPTTLEAMLLAGSSAGLVLDPVYTAKTFAALIEFAKVNPGAKLLFIHTGGGPSIFGYQSIL